VTSLPMLAVLRRVRSQRARIYRAFQGWSGREDDGTRHGPPEQEDLIGRAQIIFFSIARGASVLEVWNWPRLVRWTRILMPVR
jgi:hypothetical protein